MTGYSADFPETVPRDARSGQEASPAIEEERRSKPRGRWAKCPMRGNFGKIRFRAEAISFCSKRFLDKFLAKQNEQPTSLKEWIKSARPARRS
jgi:hypothetical protein